MFGMSLKTAKQGFFDRDKVKQAVDKGTRQVLSRFGAFVRQRAKTSIRKRPGSSPPGQPPHAHVGLLGKFILFAYDQDRKSVVIGPTLLRDESEAPKLLEHGGESVQRVDGKVKRLRYRPRPFMGPAFEQEQQKLPPLWRDSVR